MLHVKRLFSVMAVIALVLSGIHWLGIIVRPEETDEAYEQIETFHSLPQNSVEAVVYGSSHAFRGLSTIEMYQKYGIGAYNYGWHWQKINTSKLFLQDSLLSQRPKVALIESCFVSDVIQDSDVIPEVYYCRYIKDRTAKRAYMRQCMGDSPSMERRLSYVMPLAMFHDNWSDLTQANFDIPKPGASKSLLKNMGFMPSDEVMKISIPEYQKDNQEALSLDSRRELDEILQICRDHQINAVFYVAPWQGEFKYSEAMEEYADENGCVFLDLCRNYKDVGIDVNTDFMDAGHLNTKGSIKMADYLGKYLIEHYELTDMRNIDNNLWEQALAIEISE